MLPTRLPMMRRWMASTSTAAATSNTAASSVILRSSISHHTRLLSSLHAAIASTSSSSPSIPPPASLSGSSSCSRSKPAPVPVSSSTRVTPEQLLETIHRQGANTTLQPKAHPLVDTFGRFHNYLRISLTERCNLRCVYCMPEEGVDLTPTDSLLSTPEIKQLVNHFVSHGVTKLRFTGGEPTVRKDLLDLVSYAGSLRSRGLKQVCLTTNGLVLSRKLPALIQAGLTHVNISLDTLDEHKFTLMTRRNGGKQVRQAIMDAVQAVQPLTPENADQPGLRSVKINCVIMRGLNDSEILDFVELTRDHNLEVRFIEYMPFDGNRWSDKKFYSYADMLSLIRSRYPSFHRQAIELNETAKTWAVAGHRGRVGFITSMSDHFCSTCNRLRITADGNLKVCLFGPQEVSLRDAMRGGMKEEDLSLLIGAAVSKKKAQHAGMNQLAQQKNRPMITIGEMFENWLAAAPESQVRPASDFPPSRRIVKRSSHLTRPQSLASYSSAMNTQRRYFSSSTSPPSFSQPSNSASHGLSHVDASGSRPTMVDVSGKAITKRTAWAQSIVLLPENVGKLFKEDVKDFNTPKGPVFVTAIIAGTMAVKHTSNLIPFCHPLPLDNCKIRIDLVSPHPHPLGSSAIRIECEASCTAKTGVEMEALTGASVAALTCYDMLKALSHDIVISDTKLIKKTGGKSDYNQPANANTIKNEKQ